MWLEMNIDQMWSGVGWCDVHCAACVACGRAHLDSSSSRPPFISPVVEGKPWACSLPPPPFLHTDLGNKMLMQKSWFLHHWLVVMRKFFLKVTGKPSVEEKEKAEVKQVEVGVEGSSGGARRRWRLAKNMLVAFKVASTVLSVRMMVTTGSQVEREEEESRSGRQLQRRRACGRRLSFLGQQYANMVGSHIACQNVRSHRHICVK